MSTIEEPLFALFWAAVVISVVLPHLPLGRQILYPFGLLSTWVHEMGHGVVAILVGGRFHRLEIYSNLGGVAFSSGVQGATRALVSAGGLLGPPLAGAAVIVAGSDPRSASWVLVCVSILLGLSVLVVVRNPFGMAALALVAVSLGLIVVYAPDGLQVFFTQLVGIQFCMASLTSLDYMFTKRFRRDGQIIDSDTQEIANVLAFPYWFWGSLIAAVSFAVLGGAFYLAWIRPVLA